MRKFVFMSVIAMSLMSSCSSDNNATEENVDYTKKEWKSIAPEKIKTNPIQMFEYDWMLLSAGHEGDLNSMTIAWGTMGELWNKPIVTVYVSTSRYTYEFMEKNEYFTITGFPESERQKLQYMGSRSGRDEDKITNAGLTLEYTELGNPLFKESNLAVECKIIYKEQFDRNKLPLETREWYDRNGLGIHVMYVGEIVNAWVKE